MTIDRESLWAVCPRCGSRQGESCTVKTIDGGTRKRPEVHQERSRYRNPYRMHDLENKECQTQIKELINRGIDADLYLRNKQGES